MLDGSGKHGVKVDLGPCSYMPCPMCIDLSEDNELYSFI